MPSSQEIARVMAEMDRFNQTAKMTVTEERYEKRVASVGGSYGGLTALLQQGAPGNWASDHKSEAEKFAGWHYVAISSIGKAVRSANCEAYQEKVREYAKAYNEQDDDSEPLQKWHPLMKLLKRPNPSQSGASFREEAAIQLCLTGSALIWNVPNQMGRTVERYVIPTAIAEPRQPERGRPKGGWYINPEVARWQIESGWFLYTGLAAAIGKVIDARDVQVIRFIHPVFKDEGQSPVSAGALWTDTSEKVDISRHSHLRNGSDPSVIIGIDGVEDEGTLQRMSAKFNEKYAGPSKHGKAMFVNGQNVKVEPVTRTPAEMAYEGAFLQFRDAIMALHGVTPIAAGIEAPSGDDGLYAPLKQFISGTVQPILDLMAEEDTEQLAGQFGEGISVLYTAKAVDDAKLTEQQINTDIAAGAIEVDEIRKLRGRKPWGGEKGKAVAGQGAKEEPKPGLPGLAQGVPGLEPQTGSQALDPSKPPQGTPDPMKLAEEAVAKALGGFADRLSALLKTGDNCGANAEGGGGFQPGNTCGRGDGSGESGGEGRTSKKKPVKKGKAKGVLAWAEEKFGDPEKAKAFADWFGESKVVDEDGNPLTVYHGSKADIAGEFAFDPSKMGENASAEGYGFYFTTDKATASGYKPQDSGSLAEVYLRVEKPIDVNQNGFTPSELSGIISEMVDAEIARYPDEISDYKDGFLSNYIDTYSTKREAAIREVAKVVSSGSERAIEQIAELANASGSKSLAFEAVTKATGFDGVQANGYGGRGEAGGTIYVAWYPTQIKAANNQGTFDPSNPNIYKSGSSCGANAQGGGGFQPGNTCGKRDGKGGESSEGGGKGAGVNPKVLAWAREKFGDDTTAENFAKWFGDSKVVDEDGNPLTVYHGTGSDFDTFNTDRKPSEGNTTDPNAFIGAHFTSSTETADRFAEELYGVKGNAQVKPVFLALDNPLMVGAGYPPKDELAKLEASYESAKAALENYTRERNSDDSGKARLEAAIMSGDDSAIDAALADPVGDELYKKQSEILSQIYQLKENNRPVKESEIYEVAGMSYDDVANKLNSLKGKERAKYAARIGRQLKDKLSAKGYDGVFYENAYEEETGLGAGAANRRAFIAFRSTQIKSATGNSGTFDPKDPNITKSGSGCGANAEGGGGFQRGNTCGSREGKDGLAGSRRAVIDRLPEVYEWQNGLSKRQSQLIREWGVSGLDTRLSQMAEAGELPEWAKAQADTIKLKDGEQMREWKELLDSAPKFEGVVYRGINSVPFEDAMELVSSGEITFKNDQSSTWREEMSREWSASTQGKDNASFLFEIEQSSGAWVEDATSVFYGDDGQTGGINESEVILRKGARYKVSSVEFVQPDGKILSPSAAKEAVDARVDDDLRFRQERVEGARKRVSDAANKDLHPSAVKRLKAELSKLEGELEAAVNGNEIAANWMPHVDFKGHYRIKMKEVR